MRAAGADKKELLLASGLFDGAWYLARYSDVAACGLDAAEHYLRYGYRLGRDPGPLFSNSFHSLAFADAVQGGEPVTALAQSGPMPPPDHSKVLMAAHLCARLSGDESALKLAQRHLAPNHHHCLEILRANAALNAGNISGWQHGVNRYLAHFNAAALALHPSGTTLFDRLKTATPPPPVRDGPLVSVLMPVFNAGRHVEKAVRSILEQSWRNLELIIIDDCSTDSTAETLAGLAREDPRITLQRNACNVGPYVSKNIASNLARGRWITGQDADDWAHPGRIADHMAAACPSGTPRHAASLTLMVRMLASGRFDSFDQVSDFSPDGLTRISSISTLFEADLLRNKLGYWDSVRVGADSEMIGRAKRLLGNGFATFDQIGMICLSSPNSLTQHPELGVRSADGTLSKARLGYIALWEAVHSNLPPEALYLPFPQTKRRYDSRHAPAVPAHDIQTTLAKAPSAQEFGL